MVIINSHHYNITVFTFIFLEIYTHYSISPSKPLRLILSQIKHLTLPLEDSSITGLLNSIYILLPTISSHVALNNLLLFLHSSVNAKLCSLHNLIVVHSNPFNLFLLSYSSLTISSRVIFLLLYMFYFYRFLQRETINCILRYIHNRML